jgi:hypothetical protein
VCKPRPCAPRRAQAWLPVPGSAGADGGADKGGGGAAGGEGARDRDRQLLGTADGEVLLLEVRSGGESPEEGKTHALCLAGVQRCG